MGATAAGRTPTLPSFPPPSSRQLEVSQLSRAGPHTRLLACAWMEC